MRINFFVLIVFIFLAGGARGDEACNWDGLKKSIWIDDLDQQGLQMAYPVPHDFLTRSLIPELSGSVEVIIENPSGAVDFAESSRLRNEAQIVIHPRLVGIPFYKNGLLPGTDMAGIASINMDIDIADNYSHASVNTLNVVNSGRVWTNVFHNSQSDKHDQVLDLIAASAHDLARKIVAELDCVPYAARVISVSGDGVIISGGLRNHVRPGMTFAVLGSIDARGNMQSTSVAYKKLTDAVINTVSPGTATAMIANTLGQYYNSLVVTYQKQAR